MVSQTGEKAVLVFSLFGMDGTPMSSPYAGMAPADPNISRDFWELLVGRFSTERLPNRTDLPRPTDHPRVPVPGFFASHARPESRRVGNAG